MSERVLIFGGARFHGHQLTRRLAERNCTVSVLNRGRLRMDYGDGVEHLICDRNDVQRMAELLNGRYFDIVIDNNAYNPDHIDGAYEALKGRCGHYIFTSSAAVYLSLSSDRRLKEEDADGVAHGPFSPKVEGYARNKFAAEERLRQLADFNFTVLRIPNIFGQGDFLGKLSYFYFRFLDGRRTLLEKEIGRFSLINVDDVVDSFLLVSGDERVFKMALNIADPRRYDYMSFFSGVYGSLFKATQIMTINAVDMWGAGYHLPLAWGPSIDVSRFQNLYGDFHFRPLAQWGPPALNWEIEQFADRAHDKNFMRARELELSILNRGMSMQEPKIEQPQAAVGC